VLGGRINGDVDNHADLRCSSTSFDQHISPPMRVIPASRLGIAAAATGAHRRGVRRTVVAGVRGSAAIGAPRTCIVRLCSAARAQAW
jgi:hypothetical protein